MKSQRTEADGENMYIIKTTEFDFPTMTLYVTIQG